MDYKQKLEYQSNYWYNDGLKKAQIRDLSGAIVSLKRSLQFNRENITARNLLGLVYYGRGEVAEALVEWIISKNFRASENIASYYISKVQDNPSELEKVNQAVHKYNQCLGYCRQNGEDLAIIQLKKVVVAHPSFLKAYQLLALLYMHSGQYSKARQSLKTALKLDVTNDITLRYMHELNRQRNRQVAHIKEEKHGRQSVVTYNLGNETIIQPAATLRDNAAVMTVVNILIGMVVGAAVVWFLIAPAVNQTKSSTKNRNVIALSEQIASQKTQIQTLKDELEGYRNSSDEVESAKQTAASTQDSYDALVKVYQQYYGGTTSNADMADTLLGLNRDSLGEEGQKIYDSISGSVFPRVCVSLYSTAQYEVQNGNYDDAISDLEKIQKMDDSYSDGGVYKLLGDAYAGKGDKDNAKSNYEKAATDYPGTQAAYSAQSALDAMGSDGTSENTSGGTGTQGQ